MSGEEGSVFEQIKMIGRMVGATADTTNQQKHEQQLEVEEQRAWDGFAKLWRDGEIVGDSESNPQIAANACADFADQMLKRRQKTFNKT